MKKRLLSLMDENDALVRVFQNDDFVWKKGWAGLAV
jgi:hypothetical protein